VSERARSANTGGLRTQVKAALARWVLHKRRDLLGSEDAGHRPAAHDEATHAWDGRRRFAEDYVFAAVQPDLGVLVRLEWLPGRAAHRVWLMILREDAAWWIPPDETIVAQSVADRWHVAGLTLDCVQPLSRWTVRYAGKLHPVEPGDDRGPRRCEIQLEFTADGAVFVPGVDDDPELVARRLGEAHWDPALVRAVRRAAQRGYVQVGRLRGTAVVGDDVIPVDARSVRQHHWGVRDWGAPTGAVQSLLVDGGELAWVQRAEFPALTLEGGFVADDGRWRPITGIGRAARERDACELEVETGDGARRWSTQVLRAATMRVDGRGSFDLALVSGPSGVCGLWASQWRTLPPVPVSR
jgi:hypothetical protein